MSANSGDSFVDEIAQPAVDHVVSSAKIKTKGTADLRPWHKPRKQWVRKYQWGLESQRLAERLKISGARPLRYLSLPGPDMLDVRYLHGVCAGINTRLRFVGYIVPENNDLAELELSEAEVRDMPFVDSESSRVIRADFQGISDSASVATRGVADEDAFDVINLDLCKSVGEFAPIDAQRAYYDAIRNLFKLQVQKRKASEPWLFFLTTRADFDRVHAASRAAFFRLLQTACANSAELTGALKAKLGLDAAGIASCVAGAPTRSVVFELAFAAAIAEWLAHLLFGFTPQVSISLLPSSRVYGVRSPQGKDMLSLGFVCETIVRDAVDDSGLSTNSSEAGPAEREVEYPSVVKMVELIGELLNLDTVFRERPAYNTITVLSADFLATARFDRSEYVDWAWCQPEAPK